MGLRANFVFPRAKAKEIGRQTDITNSNGQSNVKYAAYGGSSGIPWGTIYTMYTVPKGKIFLLKSVFMQALNPAVPGAMTVGNLGAFFGDVDLHYDPPVILYAGEVVTAEAYKNQTYKIQGIEENESMKQSYL